jgi:hypothetical protein
MDVYVTVVCLCDVCVEGWVLRFKASMFYIWAYVLYVRIHRVGVRYVMV